MNSREGNYISIHQTLHGYSNGHSLLKSSRSLEAKTERVMSILSDMSGPSMVEGFDGYLTGYPLREEDWYAFSKTWYAQEMERPGCVWTHTLIIDFTDVPLIKNPWFLLSLFRRPKNNVELIQYGDPIVLQLAQFKSDLLIQSLKIKNFNRIANNVLMGLYKSPDSPLFISAETNQEYEDLILAIWNQQWPRLRRSFSFCTGSISSRKLNGSTFDIQAVPWKTLDKIRREVPNAHFVKAAQMDESRSSPEWVVVASKDLMHFHNDKLRKFLWNFGADEENGRKAFSRLVSAYSIYQKATFENIQISEVIEFISKYFPKRSQGNRLKSVLFGSSEKIQSGFILPFEEYELLKSLCLSKKYNSFDKKELGIRSRAKNLWKKKRPSAEKLLIDLIGSTITELGEEFILGISEAVDPSDVVTLSNRELQIGYELVTRNPGLAVSTILWEQGDNIQGQVVEAFLRSKKLKRKVLSGIVDTMLTCGVSDRVENIIELSEKYVVTNILDWYDSKSRRKGVEPTIPSAWKRSLVSRASFLLDWFLSCTLANEKSVALLAEILDPNSGVVINFDIKPWLRLPEESYNKLNSEKLNRTMAFLLTLGFNNVGSKGYELVALAFQTVHDAAEKRILTAASWRMLERHVPDLGWWSNWDKCERLRLALAGIFIKLDWPVDYFLKALKKDVTFGYILDSLKFKRYGRELLTAVAEEVGTKHLEVNTYRLSALSKYRF